MIADVITPAGTNMQMSIANNILLGAEGGGGVVQFQIKMPNGVDIPDTWFSRPRGLK